jgi:hypothetical protein
VAAQPAISLSGGAFSAAIPARSLVTYVIKPAATGNTIIITNPGNQNGTVGVPITPVHITLTDSGPNATPVISITGIPAGLTFSTATDTFTGTPTVAGTSTLTVTATDSTGASASVSFNWTIAPASTGNTITVTSPGAQSATVAAPVSVPITATDSGTGQTLTYSATTLPAGLSISSSTGVISGTPTTAGTSSVTVTAKDGTGASGSATFTWTVKPSGGGSCHVAYTTNSQWPGGFTAQVAIGNTGSTAISGWTLSFTFPGDQKITSNFNGGFAQTGENATLTNASYNGSIAAAGSVTVGFQGSWTSSDAVPTSFTLNGATCS